MADIIIVGAGPAGLSAAIYARRAGMNTVVYEAESYGGQIINTPEIDNFPGLPGVSGYEYANKLFEQAQEFGAEFVFDKVKVAEGSLEEGFRLTGEYGTVCEAKTVIIASGVKRREMGLAGEQEFTGRGISYCATCDGAFFKGKTAAVFGGGNTAVEDAIYLAGICKKVYIIHRRNQFRAEQALVDRAMNNEKIEIITPKIVTGLKGEDKLTAIAVTDMADGREQMFDVDALFIAIGQIPQADIFESLVKLENGYVVAGEDCCTSAEGIFVAGDGRTKAVRQLTTAASDGAVAALAACDFIRSLN